MLELGKKQTLQIVKTVEFGAYLAEEADAPREEQVLLPAKQVLEGAEKGDSVEVFLYKDSKDRMIATTAEPLLVLGQTAVLKVRQGFTGQAHCHAA